MASYFNSDYETFLASDVRELDAHVGAARPPFGPQSRVERTVHSLHGGAVARMCAPTCVYRPGHCAIIRLIKEQLVAFEPVRELDECRRAVLLCNPNPISSAPALTDVGARFLSFLQTRGMLPRKTTALGKATSMGEQTLARQLEAPIVLNETVADVLRHDFVGVREHSSAPIYRLPRTTVLDAMFLNAHLLGLRHGLSTHPSSVLALPQLLEAALDSQEAVFAETVYDRCSAVLRGASLAPSTRELSSCLPARGIEESFCKQLVAFVEDAIGHADDLDKVARLSAVRVELVNLLEARPDSVKRACDPAYRVFMTSFHGRAFDPAAAARNEDTLESDTLSEHECHTPAVVDSDDDL